MAPAPVKILYFSWIRERVGREEEMLSVPDTVKSVADLLSWLQGRGEEFAAALEFPDIIRVALDQEHVEHCDPIGTPARNRPIPSHDRRIGRVRYTRHSGAG